MEITIETIKKLQQTELKILQIFVQICERHNLQYYLSGGTCLGAVRHNGFIPWDDDIDVRMPRADYEKFLLCAQKHLPDYYFLQTHQTEPNSPFVFAKIRDCRTIYKETEIQTFKINHGVWIDIFPLDFCPRHYFLFNLFRRFLQLRISFFHNVKIPFIKKLLRIISCIIFPSWKIAVILHSKLLKHYKKDTGMMINSFGSKKDIMPTEWYGKGVTLTFENLKVKVPNEYDKYLTQLYGDYMQFPPPEERKPIHNIVEIKLDY